MSEDYDLNDLQEGGIPSKVSIASFESEAEDVVVAAAVVEAWEKWDDEHDGSDAVAWAEILRLLVLV